MRRYLGNINNQKKAILNASISNLKALGNLETTMSETGSSSKFEQICKQYNLTTQETEIVKLILKGTTYKMIGKSLFIAGRTVTKQVENIFQRAEVSNKIELINKLNINS